jgi:hypothetical protein
MEATKKINSFLEVEEVKKKEILALSASTAETYNSEKHRKLREMGFKNTSNYLKESSSLDSLKKMEEILEVEDFVGRIKNTLNNNQVIEYSKLVKFCKNNNLLFGKAKLYTGDIPEDSLDALMNFNFDKVKSFKQITTENSIVNSATHHGDPEVYIAASPHHFNGANGFISNKEVIESKYHRKLSKLSKNTYKDSFILSPLFFKGKIYFIIINIW